MASSGQCSSVVSVGIEDQQEATGSVKTPHQWHVIPMPSLRTFLLTMSDALKCVGLGDRLKNGLFFQVADQAGDEARLGEMSQNDASHRQ